MISKNHPVFLLLLRASIQQIGIINSSIITYGTPRSSQSPPHSLDRPFEPGLSDRHTAESDIRHRRTYGRIIFGLDRPDLRCGTQSERCDQPRCLAICIPSGTIKTDSSLHIRIQEEHGSGLAVQCLYPIGRGRCHINGKLR